MMVIVLLCGVVCVYLLSAHSDQNPLNETWPLYAKTGTLAESLHRLSNTV